MRITNAVTSSSSSTFSDITSNKWKPRNTELHKKNSAPLQTTKSSHQTTYHAAQTVIPSWYVCVLSYWEFDEAIQSGVCDCDKGWREHTHTHTNL